ncbi:succinylglutamic semialdehyde dehydrogenase, partial [Yersinia pestis PY-98]
MSQQRLWQGGGA